MMNIKESRREKERGLVRSVKLVAAVMNITKKIFNISQNHTGSGLENDPRFKELTKIKYSCYESNDSFSKYIYDKEENDETLYCPRTFDGISCWDDTPAGVTAFQNCPTIIVGFNPNRLAYKTCDVDGFWFSRYGESRAWTNYTNCVDVEDLNFRVIINNLYSIGYAISIIALLISLFIFCYFKTLRCIRIRIHMNLLAAFLFNNIVWILWYKTVTNNTDTLMENTAYCQTLHLVSTYTMVSSYAWMFIEGLYLHLSLVLVFINEDLAMKWFYIISYGVSLFLSLTYGVGRYNSGNTMRCWIDNSEVYWVIIVPVIISLLISLYFLVHVVCILVIKLDPTPNQSIAVTTKKATRAALILIPLFGLHFLLIPFRPSPENPAEKFYQVFSSILTSLQGLCVSILFCFTNRDVIAVIRLQYARYRSVQTGIPLTGTTIGESLANTREHNIENIV